MTIAPADRNDRQGDDVSTDETTRVEETEAGSYSGEAPSERAKALRDEIFGSALTLDEAAYVLGLDRTTVAKYLRENLLFGYQVGREWFVPEEELRAYVRRAAESRRQEMQRDQIGSPGAEQWSLGEWIRTNPVLVGTRGLRSRVFERFTERARTAMSLAQQEAIRLGHNRIGTEHLLLGLMSESQGRAARALANLGLTLEQVRSAVEARVGRGNLQPGARLSLTPRVRQALGAAVEEARRLGHRSIDTEDLLLGLLREGEGIAVGVLTSLGPSLERLRAETLRVIEQQIGRGDESGVETSLPPVPEEAASLVGSDQPATTCPGCGARSPAYFRFCFHCGRRLQPTT